MPTVVGSSVDADGMGGHPTFEVLTEYRRKPPGRTTVRAWEAHFAANPHLRPGSRARAEHPRSARSSGSDVIRLDGPGIGTRITLKDGVPNVAERVSDAFEKALLEGQSGAASYVAGRDAGVRAGAAIPKSVRLCGIAFGPSERPTASVLSYERDDNGGIPRLFLKVSDGAQPSSADAPNRRPGWDRREEDAAHRLLKAVKPHLEDIRVRSTTGSQPHELR